MSDRFAEPHPLVPDALARLGGPRLALLRQVATFLAVGGVGFVVDVGIFNALRATVLSPEHVASGALWAKAISVTAAIAVNWVGNRTLTFRERRRAGDGADADAAPRSRRSTAREAVEFLLASLVGSAVSLVCLATSHDLLGLTSALDDNLSANVVGLALGTVVRFVLYRFWVFARRS